MSENSTIEWTDGTWPIVVGCEEAGPGCTNCYAVLEVHRKGFNPNEKIRTAFEGLTTRKGSKNALKWNGKVRCLPQRLDWPVTRFKKPSKIFVTSMGDLFHDDVPDEFLIQVFKVMEATPQHTYQVLTKRAENMYRFINKKAQKLAEWKQWPLPNVWLGVSTENQWAADKRIPWLVSTKAAIRFLSCEPLLGPVDLRNVKDIGDLGDGDHTYIDVLAGEYGSRGHKTIFSFGMANRRKIDWVIAGGESGPKARLMQTDWARKLRDDCRYSRTKFLFKQHGDWYPLASADEASQYPTKRMTDDHRFVKVGKKVAGRLLDGRTWDEMPEIKELTNKAG